MKRSISVSDLARPNGPFLGPIEGWCAIFESEGLRSLQRRTSFSLRRFPTSPRQALLRL
ncbi:unnamed protein product [Rhodiola kirilowii]